MVITRRTRGFLGSLESWSRGESSRSVALVRFGGEGRGGG